ncbi:Gfo/Idh/MocA family oxidoreductase [Paenibacillus spiritus]|uniref:Gfo/Idh/MocA family oxidoreductase n=1 Tax=Paenibacillus spiritus TaxID=2496557 RepID=A0A5J5G9T4_9BACL|nr:Gfo/Idh/MocA family oxidoreductase [Paenibacillus spiritus]KAA9004720.1 Gfo/Idh/MocA family oxidoreductase [Paenibacillus spiritus]
MPNEADKKVPLRWGIISTGVIADKFVRDLAYSREGAAFAVGSRSPEGAEQFAGKHGIPRAYGSYEELVADPEVEAVYIGTPHPFHKENAMLALRAGKAVLCEKPFTLNRSELEEVVACAREHGVFLMEAMWSRFIPAMVQVREWIAAGKIGEVKLVKAELGFRSDWNPQGRLLNRELGGGALLDVGIYPVALASMILGPSPKDVQSAVHIGETGVDEQFSLLLGYEGGKAAQLAGAIRLGMANDVHIYGTEGRIYIPLTPVNPYAAELYAGDERVERFEDDRVCEGYVLEADEVARCLRAGLKESPVMPLDESLEIMGLLDRVRKQWGLVYPGE